MTCSYFSFILHLVCCLIFGLVIDECVELVKFCGRKMKLVLTPEDINFLEEKLSHATSGPWRVIEDQAVDTAWVSPDIEGNPIALIDYNSAFQNKADAHFIAASRNYMDVLLSEVKSLRKRILELIQSNNVELQKRLDLQEELNELRKAIQREADQRESEQRESEMKLLDSRKSDGEADEEAIENEKNKDAENPDKKDVDEEIIEI